MKKKWYKKKAILKKVENMFLGLLVALLLLEFNILGGKDISIFWFLHICVIVLFTYFIGRLFNYIVNWIPSIYNKVKKKREIKIKKENCEKFISCFKEFWKCFDNIIKISDIDMKEVTEKKEQLLEILIRIPEVEKLEKYVTRRIYDKEVDSVSQMICSIYYKLYYKKEIMGFFLMLEDYRETYYEDIIMQASRCIHNCDIYLK